MLYSWADSKKKSNLVLSVFAPGVEIPWLGNLKRLMPAAEMQDNPYKLDGDLEESPFPVETSRRRSYHSQASVVWIKGSGLQVVTHSKHKPISLQQGGGIHLSLNYMQMRCWGINYVTRVISFNSYVINKPFSPQLYINIRQMLCQGRNVLSAYKFI